MQKVMSPKLLVILIVSLLCVYLTYPTFSYFLLVNSMGDDPSVEQIQQKNKALENPRVIKLALDLQGGVDFLMEVESDLLLRRDIENEVDGIRSALAEEGLDATILTELNDIGNEHVVIQLENQEDLDLVVGALENRVSKGNGYTLQAESDLRSGLASPAGLKLVPDRKIVSRKVADATEGAIEVLKRRLNAFGLTQPTIKRSGTKRIRVQVPGENDPERIRNSMLKTASLEFRLLHPNHDQEIIPYIEGGASALVGHTGSGRIRQDLLEDVIAPETQKVTKRLKSTITPKPPVGYTLRLGRYSESDQIGNIDKAKVIEDIVYLVKTRTSLTGENLRRAYVYTDPSDFTDPVKVSIEFDGEGAKKFCRITEQNVDKRFAILLDDLVYSAPNINEPICGGSAQISGGFTQRDAVDLTTVLKAGALPAPLHVLSENSIGPSLGADSIRDSGKAILIGATLIVLMMTILYWTCGFIAVIAMGLNVLMILAVLSLMGATLSLSGIGGILLTMGMAVDANILIYERLREELDSGKPLRAAINIAFSRAFTVIVDSNITSLLPALVLVLFEVVEGTAMKGFWMAIAIGLLANLYTGIVVTRTLAEAYYAKFKKLSVGPFRFLKHVKFSWMDYRGVGMVVSGTLVAMSIGYLVVKGPSYGIDFTGGVLSVVEVRDSEVDQSDIVNLFDKDYADVRVIKVVNNPQWQITVPQLPNKETEVIPTLDEIRSDIESKMTIAYPGKITVESSEAVEPDVGNEFKGVAILSLIITCGVILAYVATRFQWIFGLGAILALSHDVFLSLGIFKMLGHSLTLDIVSALLIILGYSVNDTIVVFDRIREKMQEHLSTNVKDVINAGINETLSRTVLTSGSTLLALLVMYLFGGSGLSDFALILLLGMIFGTYSSIFIASAMVYVYLKHKGLTTVIAARKATTRVAMRSTPAKR
jgi:SecD/SecF fusion protein